MACGIVISPAAELRPLSTDRPDTTESPHTVDAGHFQFEMEIASFTRDGGEREFSLGELNAKIGLDHATDLQVVMPFYTHIRDGGEGFGDMEIRLKRDLSATASHGLTENTAIFLEAVSVLSAESGSDWEAYFNTGMTWAATPTWQSDGGIRVGLTSAATDFTPFLGLSTKF